MISPSAQRCRLIRAPGYLFPGSRHLVVALPPAQLCPGSHRLVPSREGTVLPAFRRLSRAGREARAHHGAVVLPLVRRGHWGRERGAGWAGLPSALTEGTAAAEGAGALLWPPPAASAAAAASAVPGMPKRVHSPRLGLHASRPPLPAHVPAASPRPQGPQGGAQLQPHLGEGCPGRASPPAPEPAVSWASCGLRCPEQHRKPRPRRPPCVSRARV